MYTPKPTAANSRRDVQGETEGLAKGDKLESLFK